MSAALASFSRMDSISTSYTCSKLRNRANFLPPRPVDSTAYLAPPSWVSMARANPVHRSLYRPPRTSRSPRSPGLQTEHKALPACDTVSPQAKPYSRCCSFRARSPGSSYRGRTPHRTPQSIRAASLEQEKPERPHVYCQRPRRESPSTEARCPMQHTNASRLRLALSDFRPPRLP